MHNTNCPAYIKENRIPKDSETFLVGKKYTKTNKKYGTATIYTDGKYYYYRDTSLSHRGSAAHIEVFDKTGKKHIGTADPVTGKINYAEADKNKSISNILK